MKGAAGKKSENEFVYDLEKRRLIDEMLVSKDWLSRQVAAEKPYFLYHPFINLHFPTLPHKNFTGRTDQGEFSDSMVELDHRVGQLLGHLDELGTGTYRTAMEGSLRVPFIIQWPGKVPEGVKSNEIVHVTDLFTTILSVIGSTLPLDRPIDGIYQTNFFRDPSTKSERKGFLFYIKDGLRVIKWSDWKLHLAYEPKVNQSSGKLELPYLFNIVRGPKEETDMAHFASWVLQPMYRLRAELEKSLKYDPAPPDPQKEI
ncbi:putative sulfatase [Ophiostoma piceae UAMH 11346]|uniref:Putative sulfatase n=1 Tax=Ophiostoma piceae (strain UAMH 11346) TaxID=1262450 RepID=S3BRL9_OPHP1|nr:putative sulfatase [Ophiostoma piceae UAMH 11346]